MALNGVDLDLQTRRDAFDRATKAVVDAQRERATAVRCLEGTIALPEPVFPEACQALLQASFEESWDDRWDEIAEQTSKDLPPISWLDVLSGRADDLEEERDRRLRMAARRLAAYLTFEKIDARASRAQRTQSDARNGLVQVCSRGRNSLTALQERCAKGALIQRVRKIEYCERLRSPDDRNRPTEARAADNHCTAVEAQDPA